MTYILSIISCRHVVIAPFIGIVGQAVAVAAVTVATAAVLTLAVASVAVGDCIVIFSGHVVSFPPGVEVPFVRTAGVVGPICAVYFGASVKWFLALVLFYVCVCVYVVTAGAGVWR